MFKSGNINSCKIVTDIQEESIVGSIVFHPILPFLATTVGRKTKLWNSTDPRKPLHVMDITLLSPLEAHNCIAFHPSLPLLAIGSDKNVYLLDCRRPQNFIFVTETLDRSENVYEINSVSFHPNLPFFATHSSDNNIVRLWNYEDSSQIINLIGHTDDVNLVVFHTSLPLLATCSDDNTVKLWNCTTPHNSTHVNITEHTDLVESIAFHSTPILATSSWDGTVKFWDCSNQERPVKILDINVNTMPSFIKLNPTLPFFIIGSRNQNLELWSYNIQQNASKVADFGNVTDNIHKSFAFHPSRSLVVTGSIDNSLKIWSCPMLEQYNQKGYNSQGFNQQGIHNITGTEFNQQGFNQYGFNEAGYDYLGFNKYGYNQQNIYYHTGTRYNQLGYDRNGFNQDGYNIRGLDRNGFNRQGLHNITGTEYDTLGFNVNGTQKFPESGLETFARRFVCQICDERAVNIRLDPCGHLLCLNCYNSLELPKRCPSCRTNIIDKGRIHYGGYKEKYLKYKTKYIKLKNII